ncbi:3-deoxy-D-manno-octulosonic acid transferase [Maioricimonas rarisocia]|uniref:3-deoxy-D-manno-octulosonic acid transferase n=1 Tax=Maioricimonas rarisocia TaxID=2528026 RepID=A0A517ZG32_9PLAN|nr:3-deoxy-D-manno-octulosonic acid transferase [Maioricimonas rarisocia]QDU41443.1 3-deoxy-D-manno-octulosonic acid transferase [Maioricimonas rarisocia]
MIGLLLNLLYLFGALLASPLILYRIVVQGKNRDGWAEKLFGQVPLRTSEAPCVWFHAVSVGEVLLLQTLVQQLRDERPDLECWISTTTSTGRAVAREKYPDARVFYFPFDFTWAVRRAIARVRPDLVALVELELWPNFIREVSRRDIPLAMVNGRMSDRSFRGYRRLRPLMKRVFASFDRLAVQADEYGQRLVELGSRPEAVIVTGSVKFDGVQRDRHHPLTAELRSAFGLPPDARVFIAGSTQAPEEEIALSTYRQLQEEFPDLRLILVPRHKERFNEVADLVKRAGLPLRRRTQTLSFTTVPPTDASSERPVLLLDTLGELAACWGLADIAFVGGSLTKRGGQNMIEPAAYGAAVLFGPNTQHFRQVVQLLLSADAARVVCDGAELTSAVRDYLQNPLAARRMGEAARRLVFTQQGATERTVEVLRSLLPDSRQESKSRREKRFAA